MPVTTSLYGEEPSTLRTSAMPLTQEQLRILQDIHATTPVSEAEATWAVREDYAAQGEDGDLALSQKGLKAIDGSEA